MLARLDLLGGKRRGEHIEDARKALTLLATRGITPAERVRLGADPDMLLVGPWAAAYVAAFGGLVGYLAARRTATGAATARVQGAVATFVTFVGLWLVDLLLGMGAHTNSLRQPSAVIMLSPTWAASAAGDVFVSSHTFFGHLKTGPGFMFGAAVYAAPAAGLLTAMTVARRRSLPKG